MVGRMSIAGLKAVVIALGVLLLALLAAIVWRFAGLAGGAGSAGARGFGEVKLELPPGCRVVEATAGDGRILLRIGEGAACERVLLVDPSSGRVTGTLRP